MNPDFDTMNETDVREIIVRPLLQRLGFRHGTQANIRTEVTLRYDRAFLGRKNSAKGPVLGGRADYICEAISYGRWTVEVKAPSEPLSQDAVEQAHTYSAHPEIAATPFLLSNGREFRLYATGDLQQPILAWTYEETEQHLMTLFNIVGYEAIKKRARLIRADVAKPLGPSLSSRLRVVGGQVTYGEHHSDHPLFGGGTDALKGMIGSITGGYVDRDDDGRIRAFVEQLTPFQQLAELNRLAGIGDYLFYASDEFISTDPERPTILQNVVSGRLEPGASFSPMPGMPRMTLPVGFTSTVYTEATGYIQGDEFKGLLSFDYDYVLLRGGRASGNPMLDNMLRQMPPTAKLVGGGEFVVRYS